MIASSHLGGEDRRGPDETSSTSANSSHVPPTRPSVMAARPRASAVRVTVGSLGVLLPATGCGVGADERLAVICQNARPTVPGIEFVGRG